jgi:DNA-binding transcriptional ArsR family regulator
VAIIFTKLIVASNRKMKLKNISIQYASEVFKALSDESRLRILHLLLQNGAMSVGDLELILDFTQTKTSRHLQYLRKASLLELRRTDQWILYSIKDEAKDFLEEVFAVIEKSSILGRDQETYRILLSNRELSATKLQARYQRYKG